jgi:hypothetical protein
MNTRKLSRSVFVGTVLAATMALAAASPAAANGGRPLDATLLGSNEVPPASTGDPDGSGFAHLTLNQGQGEICFDISVQNIGAITLAHIHRGVAGSNGSVVVDFKPALNGLSGCVSADAELIKTIRQNPEGYYVNVHTTEFPGGAVRGQLSK